MAMSLKNFKGIRTPFVFFDETGSINDKANRYFCLGMIKCMQPYYLDTKIRSARQRFGFYDEIKWNTISKTKTKVIDQILDDIFLTPGIYFSCVVINKDNLDFSKEFGNDPYKAYQSFTEILLKDNVEENEILTVLADYVTTPKGDKNKKKILSKLLRQLGTKSFVGGLSQRRFKVFEYPEVKN